MGGRNICLIILYSMVKGELGIFLLFFENFWLVLVVYLLFYNL